MKEPFDMVMIAETRDLSKMKNTDQGHSREISSMIKR